MAMSDACRRDYRRRITVFIDFLKAKRNAYYRKGVRKLTDAERNDPDKYYFQHTHDLKYRGMNYKEVQNFFALIKRHDSGPFKGMLKSKEDIRKYKNAIEWGAQRADEGLPSKVFEVMDQFVANYQVEHKKAQKRGDVAQEKSADPIPMTLYKQICRWALDESNMLLYVWTTAQWNCMARGANIAPLKLENIQLGPDSLIIKYDDSKADQAGERTYPKNIYACTFDWTTCFWTALGVWLALRVAEMKDGNQKLFLKGDAKPGAASSQYCEQLASLLTRHKGVVENQMRFSRCNPYSLRKGSASHSSGGTTAPPSFTAICHRGEWSISGTLDHYIRMLDPGDQYLGRTIAGFDPNADDFDVLPPHFLVLDPMSDESINKAMKMTFGGIIDAHPESVALLVRLLACLVYHSDEMMALMTKRISEGKGHDFSKLSIFNDIDLLRELRGKVTVEPTVGVIEKATGIPPSVIQLRALKDIYYKLQVQCEMMSNQTVELSKTMKDTVEQLNIENGQVSQATLTAQLDAFKTDIIDNLSNQLRELGPRGHAADTTHERAPLAAVSDGEFFYADKDGQMKTHFIPKGFKLPTKSTLDQGLQLWLKGMTVAADGSKFVRPFRRLKRNGQFHGVFCDTFKKAFVQQYDIFAYLEKHVGEALPANTKDMSPDDIERYYEKCVEVLKNRASFAFADPKRDALKNWSIATWTLKTRRSYIQKHGNASDKAHLPAENSRNGSRPGLKRHRQQKIDPLYERRQRQRVERNARNTAPEAEAADRNDDDDPFGAAFGGVEINADRHADRDNTIRQEALAEMAEERREAQNQRNQLGDGVGTDGNRLYVVRREGLQQNYAPDNSEIERQNYRSRLRNHV